MTTIDELIDHLKARALRRATTSPWEAEIDGRIVHALSTLQEQKRKLIADLAKFDWELACEGCGAPLFEGDDYVSDPDGCSGCWAAMTDRPSERARPCYAYRVGKKQAGSAQVHMGGEIGQNTSVSADLGVDPNSARARALLSGGGE